MPSKIFIIDNDASLAEKINTLFRNNGYVSAAAYDYAEAKKIMRTTLFDIVIADASLKQIDSIKLLEDIRKINAEIKIIFIGQNTDIVSVVELMHQGAFYFLPKPLNPEILLEKVRVALANKDGKKEKKSDKCTDKVPYSYVQGNSEIAHALFEEIKLVAPTDYTVIIQGETGTGKESVARLIHQNSRLADKPFIAMDCGSLTKELAASELFGHEKGSFTGAVTEKTGAFQLADGGTLFLDEIGNLPYEVQIYLLRSVQESIIRKVGGSKEISVNVRLITATNEDLQKAVNEKKFREDLYHRLNEFTLEIPPLRERKDDIQLFIRHFIDEASLRLDKKITGIKADALEVLLSYNWPGNIRELKNVIKNACLRTEDGEPISKKVFPPDLKKKHDIPWMHAQTSKKDIDNLKHETDIKNTVRTAETETIMRVLEQVNYNKTKAAEILKIDRKTLYNKLKNIP